MLLLRHTQMQNMATIKFCKLFIVQYVHSIPYVFRVYGRHSFFLTLFSATESNNNLVYEYCTKYRYT